MASYLLYDGGCGTCTSLAAAIEIAAANKLRAADIRGSEAGAWLEEAYGDTWAYQPYLVTASRGGVRASYGVQMALQLGWLLGPRKAWHVWKIVRARGVALRLQRASSGGIARRVLLKTGLAGFAALTARFALPSGSAHACEPCGGGAYACGQYCALTSCTDFPCCCYSPGAGKDYSCYDNQTGELCSTHSDRCCFCSC